MDGSLRGRFRGLVLDMDGVLYRGNQPLPGARELFPAMRAAGLQFLLLTNNATLTAQDFSNKLARMGISVAPEAIVTSASATAVYLQGEFPHGARVHVVGEEGLVSYVASVPGFRLDGWNPEVVVVGLDRRFDYDKMQRACSAIRAGARFVATNADATLPVEAGEEWPGAGSIVASIATCSGVDPFVVGKPSPFIGGLALQQMDLPPQQVLCVGDRLMTDIALGKAVGMPTALVLTGVNSKRHAEVLGLLPDYYFDDLLGLRRALGI